MPPAAWFEPMEAQRSGQAPLLLMRMAALGAFVVVLPNMSGRRVWGAGCTVAGLFLVSLAVNAAALALPLVVGVSAARAVSGTPELSRPRALLVALAFACASVLTFWPENALPAAGDRTLALDSERQNNPYRALFHARRWAAAEPGPGEATLCLARLAERFGDLDAARDLASLVAREGTTEELRRAAAAMVGRAP